MKDICIYWNRPGNRDKLMEQLRCLERCREFFEEKRCDLSLIESLDKEIEDTQNKLSVILKNIKEEEKRERRNALTIEKFEQLLAELGLEFKEPKRSIESMLAIAQCLLAGFEKEGHLFYNLLHSKDSSVQKKAKQNVRIIKRYIELCYDLLTIY